jgi:hypothetical protein
MNKILCLMFGVCLLSGSALADTVRFTCQTEESANIVAAALAISQEKADKVAHPFLERGECEYLPDDIFVYIVHRGETFGTALKITVVGLSRESNGAMPAFFGLMPTEEAHADSSI